MVSVPVRVAPGSASNVKVAAPVAQTARIGVQPGSVADSNYAADDDVETSPAWVSCRAALPRIDSVLKVETVL